MAAERREFDGIVKRFGGFKKMDWEAEFAGETEGNGDRFVLIANGPGSGLVSAALSRKIDVDGLISTGFCGALDPALRVGDIVRTDPNPLPVSGGSVLEQPGRECQRAGLDPFSGDLCSIDRVVVTAREKRELRENTGARAVDMESAAIAQKAAGWGLPFQAVRAVSDTADDDLPLDFNLFRDAEGRFSRSRIALAAVGRPFTAVPALLRLDRNCRRAAESLGNFFAHSRL